MNVSQALELADNLVVAKTARHLSDLQRLLLEEFWTRPSLRYDEVAQTHGYSASYLKQDAGPKLWRSLSDACGEKVSKTNFRAALERKWSVVGEKENLSLPKNSDSDRATIEEQHRPALSVAVLTPPKSFSTPELLRSPAVSPDDNLPPAQLQSYQDWGIAPDVSTFYDRYEEIAQLKQWIVGDRCRLVAIVGLGGIGKTYLGVKLAEQIQDCFQYVIWRSLRNAPPLQQILTSILQSIANSQEIDLAATVHEKISCAIEFFRNYRCLLILDNVETILQGGVYTGYYQEGYEDYGEFFKYLGEGRHHSCLLLTTREKPKEISIMQGETLPIRCLRLQGLSTSAGLQLLRLKGCYWTSEKEGFALVEQYSGHPLALKIIASTIRELFEGNISEFAKHNLLVIDEIRTLLEEQFERLTDLGKALFYWIAINLEPVSAEELSSDIYPLVSKPSLVETLKSLVQRSLIEQTGSQFVLQPVVREYAIGSLVKQVCEEIETGNFAIFNSHALLKAQAKDYIRQTQIKFILNPILDRLLTAFKTKSRIANHFKQLIHELQMQSPQSPGYAAGNMLNILCQMQIDVSGYDFSHLTVWQAYLQGTNLHDVNFTGADLAKSVFAKHLTNVLAIAFSPDGTLLATGDANGEICLWLADDGTLLRIYEGHAGWVNSIIFSPKGNLLCSGSSDRTVKIWDVGTGNCLKTLSGHNQRVRTVAFSPDGQTVASSSGDRTVRLWDIQTGWCQQIYSGHTSYVWSVSFSPDGKTLASGSEDRTIKLWDVLTGKCLQTWQDSSSWVRTLTFSPDGKTLASGGGDRNVKLWDTSTGTLLASLPGHSQRLRSVAFSPDGKLLASGSGDRTVKIWDLTAKRCLKTLHGHSSRLCAVTFSPDGNTLVSGGEDRTVRFWEVSTGNCNSIWQGYASWFQSVAFSPDGKTLASGSEDGTVKLWQTNRNSSGPCNPITLLDHAGWVCSVAFSPDGTTLASASSDYTIKLWDASSGACLKTLLGNPRWIRSIAFSPNGKMLASGGGDNTVKLWNLRSGNCCATLRSHAGWLWSVAFSPNGAIVASASEDKTVKIWCVHTGECLKTFEGHSSWVQAVAFSPDGKLLASGSCDQTIKLWDIDTGKCLKTFWDHVSWVQTVAFSPDGKFLASGSCDQTVKFWEIDTGECWQTLSAHKNWVWSIAFSPNGDILASAGQDETIKLWKVSTGECLETLRSKRLYEGMCLSESTHLTAAQLATLKLLGAFI
uniref:WD40 domain P-loop ATPase domain n=1 Tax=Oscillatoria sp. PCC 6602 TaxID=587413 RepID=A0A6H1V626_9CYAN|nr:WD40 domain P-loop ATPase domain [Oscillatoria sp. PCC 6602]